MSVYSGIRKTVDFAVSHLGFTAGAVAGSQYPTFIDQYVDVLRGCVDEAARNVQQWQEIADKTTQSSLDLLIGVYMRWENPEAVIEGGRKISSDIERYQELMDAYEAITKNNSFFERGLDFFKHVDWKIADSVIPNFNPAVPLTVESLGYAGIGAAIVAGSYYGGKVLLSTFSRCITAKK